VAELAAPFRMSQPAVSRHLKVLEQAGLISRHRRATARLSRLEAEPLREATVWLADYREYWTESYERLDELVARLLAESVQQKDEKEEKDVKDQDESRKPGRKRGTSKKRS
jgi:DNA-binding transcriptional ArsR family regulator